MTIYDPSRFLTADHYGGFAVGLVVVYSGLRVARDASLQLMDTMPDPALMEQIRAVAMTVPNVRGVEKCFARKTGLQYHVDLHLEVDTRYYRARVARNRHAGAHCDQGNDGLDRRRAGPC